jgi:hypothetical protein
MNSNKEFINKKKDDKSCHKFKNKFKSNKTNNNVFKYDLNGCQKISLNKNLIRICLLIIKMNI